MKKLFFLLIALVGLNSVTAQITQVSAVDVGDLDNSGFLELEDEGKKYYYVDSDDMTFVLYNADHSVFKTIQIPLDLYDDTTHDLESVLFPFCTSKYVFNSDDNIEYLLSVWTYPKSGGDGLVSTYIINEEGTILFEKAGEEPAYTGGSLTQFPGWITNTDNGTFMLFQDIEDTQLITYSVPGSIPCYECNPGTPTAPETIAAQNYDLKSFPNPADEQITISYEIPEGSKKADLLIYNMNGVLIKSYEVDGVFNNLVVQTSEFVSGTYLYQLKADDFVSPAEKFVVK